MTQASIKKEFIALELEEQALSVWERLLPPGHPDLLHARQSLAFTRMGLGDLLGALELDERVHRELERTLPSGPPELLKATHGLAMKRMALGDLSGARKSLEMVHGEWERWLPADHPDLLNFKLDLAYARYLQDDLTGAREAPLAEGANLSSLRTRLRSRNDEAAHHIPRLPGRPRRRRSP